MNINDFQMKPSERRTMLRLLRRHRPARIAEFGCGWTTGFLAENSDARIVTWDNLPEWVDLVKDAYKAKTWRERVEFRLYDVTPQGPRAVEKDPVHWDGPKFDFLFLDGPRSAHDTSHGRHGSFRFARLHAADGACIVWHDYDRPHEREMAARYMGDLRIHDAGTIGWCVTPGGDGMLKRFLARFKRAKG